MDSLASLGRPGRHQRARCRTPDCHAIAELDDVATLHDCAGYPLNEVAAVIDSVLVVPIWNTGNAS